MIPKPGTRVKIKKTCYWLSWDRRAIYVVAGNGYIVNAGGGIYDTKNRGYSPEYLFENTFQIVNTKTKVNRNKVP